ncbi:MAG: hypothetical protein EPN30_10770 [Actinomycetota bacterium]|nr:MAG: hypothetical protein EPN30_10770 [Actinomycetota bacterium]
MTKRRLELSVAVLDIGTSNVRASAVSSDGSITAQFRTKFKTASPTRGFVEFDAEELYQNSVSLLVQLLAQRDCSALAITNQRASTVVFDPTSKKPVCPGQSWQDIRTAPMCLAVKAPGISISPNQSASKIALMMDLFDKERSKELLGGTIDAWLTYRLTGNFKTEHTNAAMSGLVEPNATRYDDIILAKLNILKSSLPQIQQSFSYFGDAVIGNKQLPLLAILGDQQASMLGQGITRTGEAKATFGTGAMVDIVTGNTGPSSTNRLPNGTFPIVARSQGTDITFGLEAIGLHAGSAVEFACFNLGLADSPMHLEELAKKSKQDSKEIFVPALTGLATPEWDFGALGAFTNITHATTKAELANAVLCGIAHIGADLVEAIEADGDTTLEHLSVDGGMTQNLLFLQHLANFSQKILYLSSAREATTVGAGLAAHISLGEIADINELAELIPPRKTIEPQTAFQPHALAEAREGWAKAIGIARNSVPELSAVIF